MDTNRYSLFYTQLIQKFEDTLSIDKSTLSMVLGCDTVEHAINNLLKDINQYLKGSSIELWFNDITYNRYYLFDSEVSIRHISRSLTPSLTAFHFDHFFGKDQMFYTEDLNKVNGLSNYILKNKAKTDGLLVLPLPINSNGVILIYNPKNLKENDMNVLVLSPKVALIEALLTVEPVETDLFIVNHPPVNINALSALEKMSHPEVHLHELKASILAKAIGTYLKYPYYEVQKLALAGRLHDIGKLFIPLSILKKGCLLNPDEIKLLCTHVTIGQEVLTQLGFSNDIIKLVFEHHERYNGKGYPQGLKSYQWTLDSQIISITSELVAIGTNDPYHEKDDAIHSIYDLIQHKGQYYSVEMIDTIEQMIKDKQLLHLIK